MSGYSPVNSVSPLDALTNGFMQGLLSPALRQAAPNMQQMPAWVKNPPKWTPDIIKIGLAAVAQFNEFPIDNILTKNVQDLRNVHPTNYPAEACHTIAEYGRAWLVNRANIDSSLPPDEQMFKIHALKGMVHDHQELARKAIEASLLKAFTAVCKRLEVLSNDRQARLNLGESIIGISLNHFKKIGEATENGKRKVPIYNMRKIFHEDKALKQLADLGVLNRNSKEGEAEMLNGFYKELSGLILDVACPNGKDDLEMPDIELPKKLGVDISRAEIYKLLREKILPNILYAMIKNTIEPHTRNIMLLNSMETMFPSNAKQEERYTFSELKSLLQQILSLFLKIFLKIFMKNTQPPKSAQELANEQRVTDLSEQLIKLFPKGVLKKLFRVPQVKNLSGSMLGPILQKQFETMNFKELMDNGIKNGLTAWHGGGEWNNGKFSPKYLDEDGSLKSGFRFKFTETKAEKDEKDHIANVTKEKLRKKVFDVMNEFSSPIKLYYKLNRGLQILLGIPFWFCWILCKVISKTIFDLDKFWDNHLYKQVDRVMDILQMDINEHLVCSLAKEMFKQLAPQAPAPAPAPAPAAPAVPAAPPL